MTAAYSKTKGISIYKSMLYLSNGLMDASWKEAMQNDMEKELLNM